MVIVGPYQMETGDSKNVYSTLKSLTKTNQLRTDVINDQEGKLITDSKKVLKRWTEYCKGLYNYKIHPDTSLLQTDLPSTDGEDSLPIMKEEVEAAVWSLKCGKSPGVDNIPSELIKLRQRSCQGPNSSMSADLGTEKVAKGVDTIIDDTTTKERKSQVMQESQNDKPGQPSQ